MKIERFNSNGDLTENGCMVTYEDIEPFFKKSKRKCKNCIFYTKYGYEGACNKHAPNDSGDIVRVKSSYVCGDWWWQYEE